jgi:hypothetical protein
MKDIKTSLKGVLSRDLFIKNIHTKLIANDLYFFA